MLPVVVEQPGDRAGRAVASCGDQVAQLQQQRLDLDVGQAGDPAAAARFRPQHSQRPVRAGPGAGQCRDVLGDRSDRDDRGHPLPHAVHEFGRDGHRPLLAVALALHRDQPVGHVPDEGARGTRVHRGQVHREAVAHPLQFGRHAGVVALAGAAVGECERQHHNRTARQPQPGHGLACSGAAFERGAEQFGAQAAGHVGARADPQHVQRDEPGRLPQRLLAFGAERFPDRRPDRAEHLVAGPHGDGDPGHREAVEVDQRVDVDQPVAAVQLAEHAPVGEHPGEAFRHLPSQDRLHPGRVGFVLAAGERQHPRARVLDRHRRVDQLRDRVGHREQIAGGDAAQHLRLGLADVALGEQRPQHRGQLRPGRPAREAQQHHAGLVDGGGDLRRHGDRRAHHQPRRLLLAEPAQQADDVRRLADTNAEHERVAGQHGFLERVVDRDAADVPGAARVAVDEVEQRATEVVEDADHTGAHRDAPPPRRLSRPPARSPSSPRPAAPAPAPPRCPAPRARPGARRRARTAR